MPRNEPLQCIALCYIILHYTTLFYTILRYTTAGHSITQHGSGEEEIDARFWTVFRRHGKSGAGEVVGEFKKKDIGKFCSVFRFFKRAKDVVS